MGRNEKLKKSTSDLNDSLVGSKEIRYENIKRVLRALIEPQGKSGRSSIF